MNRRQILGALCATAIATAPGFAHAAYPERPITLIVPWGAGGGTDAVARLIGIELEKELKTPVNVVNRTGGSGVVGHTAISTAKPDGYTIGIITVEITQMHWQGLTKMTWQDFTPLALVNFDANALLVRSDSPYNTIDDVLAAARANPGKLTFTCPASLKANLDRYAALHAQTYGETVDAVTLIPHMLDTFMVGDRGFRKGRRTNP